MRQPDLKNLAAQPIQRNRETAAADWQLRELQEREATVERQLHANPPLQYAFDVRDAPLLPAPVHPSRWCVIVTSELHLPQDKFDPGLFFETMEKPQ